MDYYYFPYLYIFNRKIICFHVVRHYHAISFDLCAHQRPRQGEGGLQKNNNYNYYTLKIILMQ
jgi:hypothetical protein